MSSKQEFAEKFKSEVIIENNSMSDDLLALFDKVLADDFKGDGALMDDFINSLSNEYSADVELSPGELQNRQAILELTDMFLGGL